MSHSARPFRPCVSPGEAMPGRPVPPPGRLRGVVIPSDLSLRSVWTTAPGGLIVPNHAAETQTRAQWHFGGRSAASPGRFLMVADARGTGMIKHRT